MEASGSFRNLPEASILEASGKGRMKNNIKTGIRDLKIGFLDSKNLGKMWLAIFLALIEQKLWTKQVFKAKTQKN